MGGPAVRQAGRPALPAAPRAPLQRLPAAPLAAVPAPAVAGCGPLGVRARWSWATGPVPSAALEVLLLGALFLVYKLGRVVAARHAAQAFVHAAAMWAVERRLHLPDELWLQRVLLDHHHVARAANLYYAGVHFPVTIAVMVWCWCRRKELYGRLRSQLVLLTASGLVLHLAVPMAPPRLLPQLGFVDVAALIGPSVYGPPATDTLADQYAALPSLHIGWAVVVALVLVRGLRTPWRWLWVLHPVLTVLVVVGTGNHYWLDGAAAVVLLALVSAARELVRLRRPRPCRPPASA